MALQRRDHLPGLREEDNHPLERGVVEVEIGGQCWTV